MEKYLEIDSYIDTFKLFTLHHQLADMFIRIREHRSIRSEQFYKQREWRSSGRSIDKIPTVTADERCETGRAGVSVETSGNRQIS